MRTFMVGTPTEKRKRAEALGTWSETNHNSEQGFAFDQFDHTINNVGMSDDLNLLNLKALKLWSHIFPAKIEIEKPPVLTPELRHIRIIDALLRKHYGCNINDTGMEDEAPGDIAAGYRPYECVNAWASEYNIDRVDTMIYGVPVSAPLKELDEATVYDYLQAMEGDVCAGCGHQC